MFLFGRVIGGGEVGLGPWPLVLGDDVNVGNGTQVQQTRRGYGYANTSRLLVNGMLQTEKEAGTLRYVTLQ